jgi:GNAT superfamily N-acetyltransferase
LSDVAKVQLKIRDARPSDRAAILALVPRLRDFGPSALRPAAALDRAETEALGRALDALPENAALIVAERADRSAAIAGVAYMETAIDYFTRESHAHLGILIVAGSAEGHGVGRALMDAVERWARGKGHRFITLNVFSTNDRARRFYERSGYVPDTVRYAKELTE